MVTRKINIWPSLSEIWFKAFTSNCPKKPIKTPQELDNLMEKQGIALNSSLELSPLDSVEWASCRNNFL